MKKLFVFAKLEVFAFFRNRLDMFWTFAFPIVMLVLSVVIFGPMIPEGISKSLAACRNVLVIVLTASCFFSLSSHTANLREKQILLHYHTTPVQPAVILLGLFFRQVFVGLFNMFFIVLITLLIYQPDFSKINIPALAFMLFIASFTFASMGMLVAAIARSPEQSVWISNVLFLPFMFLSGSTLPTHFFPEWLQTVSKFIPSTYLHVAITDIFFYEEGFGAITGIILAFVGMSLVFTFLAAKIFRWS